MNYSQVILLTALANLSAASHAEISGSGHQVLGCTGVVRSLVWHDANRNGVQDAGEVPLSGVALLLEREDSPELGADTLLTDGGGHARFFNLCLRTHLLRVDPATLPPGMTPTSVNVAGEERDVFDSDGNGAFEPVEIELSEQHVSEETVDFGFARPVCDGSIGDRVWLDEDGNGLQDDFESGLAGIVVGLTDDSGLGLQAVTDRQGRYRIDELCPGAYAVTIDAMPPSFATTVALQGDDPGNDSQPPGGTVLLEDQDDGVDFGLNRPGCRSVLAGALFDDANLSATQEPGEIGLAGVAVSIIAPDGYQQLAISDGQGQFRLPGLCAGSYVPVIDEASLPAGALPTTLPMPQSVAVGDNDTYVEMASVGYSAQCAGQLGDRVWLDQNGNGQQDLDEFGLPGARVLMRDALGNALGERVTDDSGRYLFVNLCAGDYALQVDATSIDDGFTPTAALAGDPQTDSDGPAPVWRTLGPGAADDLSVDFGYLPPQCALRVDTECHPLSLESSRFECDKDISRLSMIWRGSTVVRVVAYLGDDRHPVLTEIDDVAPGQRVEVAGYEDAPKDVMWRIFDVASGQHLGDSWFKLECDDKDMDGPEDCGTPQGDGKNGDKCDGECINDWSLDGIVDKRNRLQCSSDDVVTNGQCVAQKDTLVLLRHELRNVGRGTAGQIQLDAGNSTATPVDQDIALEPGGRFAFSDVVPVDASADFSFSARNTEDGADCSASRSTPVSATPIPDCSVYGLSVLEKGDDKIKWRLINAGIEDAVISRVDVAWPDAHAELKEIKRGGDKIVDERVPPGIASFGESRLNGNRDKRRMKKGKEDNIEIKFEEKYVDSADSDYAISVYFEEGCAVTLTP